jgi:AcrR family transcriptional regulator
MPRTPEQNQQLRADSHRRLLAAARRTFVRLGFDRATIRDIAGEAGVAQGLLYNYFRSKDDLLREVFLEGTRDVAAAFVAGAAGGTPAERLERMIRRSLEIVRERRDFWQLSYMLRHHPRTVEVLGDVLPTWTTGVRGSLETLLREIGHDDAAGLALVLFAAIDGVAQHYVLDPDEYPLEAVADCLVRSFGRPPAEPALPHAPAGPRTMAARPGPRTRARRGGSHDPQP